MRRGFGWLWTSAGTANLGDGLSVVLLPLVAVGLGAGPAVVALVSAATVVAWPVLGLFAGWFVDRTDGRWVLCLANVARAGLLAGGAIAATQEALTTVGLVALAAGYGLAETLADTAIMSLVPVYAPSAESTRANARIEGTMNLLNQLAGPPLAGVLLALGATTALGVGAGLYVVAGLAAAALLRPSLERCVQTAPDEELTHRDRVNNDSGSGVGRGLVFIWASPALRNLTSMTAAMNLVWGCFTGLFVIHALDVDGLDLSPRVYGLILTAMALGGLLASITAVRIQRRFGTKALLLGDCVGTILLVAPTALGFGPSVTVLGLLVAGAGATVWRILVASIRQAITPPSLAGRVYSASRVISWGALPAGSLLAGGLAEATDVRTAFAAASLVALAITLAYVLTTARLSLEPTNEAAPRSPA